MSSFFRRTRRLLSFSLVALVALVIAGSIYLEIDLERVPTFTAYRGRVADTGGTNWLIVGSDSRQGLTEQQQEQLSTGDTSDAEGARTDTIMLLHIPAAAAPTTLVSLPRDSLVPIYGHGLNKLNASFSLGGPTLLARTVEQTTGVHIDHYLEIGLGGFAGVVDSVGGVQMCLPSAIRDPKINLSLPPGCQVLNGAQALGFVRTRNFDLGDIEREEHQRQFLSALIQKCTSRGVLLNPLRALPMAADAAGTVTVADHDHVYNLLQLAWAMRGSGNGTLVPVSVPTSGSSDLPGIGSALVWDNAKAGKLFASLREGTE